MVLVIDMTRKKLELENTEFSSIESKIVVATPRKEVGVVSFFLRACHLTAIYNYFSLERVIVFNTRSVLLQ